MEPPPTLCMTSTRDYFLSGTADFHRALLRAGVDARLMVFDAMPHAFWYRFDLPESKEALEAQANFRDQHLGWRILGTTSGPPTSPDESLGHASGRAVAVVCCPIGRR